jgi:hypothetical protein
MKEDGLPPEYRCTSPLQAILVSPHKHGREKKPAMFFKNVLDKHGTYPVEMKS